MIKHFTYSSPKQIFRILISDSDHLVFESRDTNSKEVFFSCFNLETGDPVFENFQHEEKSWIGIEAVYKGIIFFHKYPKQDMPGHKEIIALDISSRKIIWHNEEQSFLFVHKDKVYGFTQGFEERRFIALDYLTGEIMEDLSNDYMRVSILNNESEAEKNWDSYIYPEIHTEGEEEDINNLINSYINKEEVCAKIEYAVKNGLLFFNYHVKNSDNSFSNNFAAVEIAEMKYLLKETLNSNAPALFTDSFFLYKEFLFLLKEKNGIVIYKLE